MVPMNLVPIPRRRTTVPWPPGRFKFIFGPPSSLGSRQQRRSREGESRHEATRNRITHGDTSTVPRHSSLPNRIHWTMSNELLASRALAAPARPDVVCSRELLNRAHLLNILRPHRVRVRARRRGRDQSDGQGASLRPGRVAPARSCLDRFLGHPHPTAHCPVVLVGAQSFRLWTSASLETPGADAAMMPRRSFSAAAPMLKDS